MILILLAGQKCDACSLVSGVVQWVIGRVRPLFRLAKVRTAHNPLHVSWLIPLSWADNSQNSLGLPACSC